VRASRESPDMTPEKNYGKMGDARSHNPQGLIFGALNANSSKMSKDMNFKFGMHAPRQSQHDS